MQVSKCKYNFSDAPLRTQWRQSRKNKKTKKQKQNKVKLLSKVSIANMQESYDSVPNTNLVLHIMWLK